MFIIKYNSGLQLISTVDKGTIKVGWFINFA